MPRPEPRAQQQPGAARSAPPDAAGRLLGRLWSTAGLAGHGLAAGRAAAAARASVRAAADAGRVRAAGGDPGRARPALDSGAALDRQPVAGRAAGASAGVRPHTLVGGGRRDRHRCRFRRRPDDLPHPADPGDARSGVLPPTSGTGSPTTAPCRSRRSARGVRSEPHSLSFNTPAFYQVGKTIVPQFVGRAAAGRSLPAFWVGGGWTAALGMGPVAGGLRGARLRQPGRPPGGASLGAPGDPGAGALAARRRFTGRATYSEPLGADSLSRRALPGRRRRYDRDGTPAQ